MGFSKDFLWGSDISAAQAEGAWDKDGKSPVEVDYMLAGSKTSFRFGWYRNKDGSEGKVMEYSGLLPEGAHFIRKEGEVYPNDFGCKFYEHWKEDIQLCAQLGLKALNLTLSWARILPHGVKGGVNEKGVEFYRNVLEECKKYNIEPIAFLYKYDMPVFYIEEMRGWSNRELMDEYLAFAKICFTEFKDLVKYWVTFNELNVLWLVNSMNPAHTAEDSLRVLTESHHQMVASAKAVVLAHDINPDNQVGCMCAGVEVYPYTCDPADVYDSIRMKQYRFFYFADTIMRGSYPSFAKRIWKEEGIDFTFSEEDAETLKKGKADFLAFSYYNSACTTTHQDEKSGAGNLFSGEKNPYLEESEWGWAIDPIGMRSFLNELNDRYEKPLLIAENGLGAMDNQNEDGTIHDTYRIEYFKKHIAQMKEAVDDGVRLFGYTTWSVIDLISFSSGELRKRYGFIYVDADDEGNGTFKRYKKDSFSWYRHVIETNGEEI